jgi:hypothetical protein
MKGTTEGPAGEAAGAVHKCGWETKEWCTATATSMPRLYQLLGEGTVRARKDGRKTIITTPPEEFLTGLPPWTPGRLTEGLKAAATKRGVLNDGVL